MPLLCLCVQAQQFYKKRSINTKVKACATLSVDEILQLAGMDTLTIMSEDLQNLQKGTGCIRLVIILCLTIATILHTWMMRVLIVLTFLVVAKVKANTN